MLKDFPQCWQVDAVECLVEVNEIHYHRPTYFCHFLYDLSQGKYLIHARSATPETRV